MHLEVPNGYFVEQYCLWGDPYAGNILSRIYAADFPDLWASDDQAFMALENDMRLMLRYKEIRRALAIAILPQKPVIRSRRIT